LLIGFPSPGAMIEPDPFDQLNSPDRIAIVDSKLFEIGRFEIADRRCVPSLKSAR
jgi:hypothetical protein